MQQQPVDAPINSTRAGLSKEIVGRTAILLCPEVIVGDSTRRKKRGRGRGGDKLGRRKRMCQRCKGRVSDAEAIACYGSHRRESCQRFDGHGNPLSHPVI